MANDIGALVRRVVDDNDGNALAVLMDRIETEVEDYGDLVRKNQLCELHHAIGNIVAQFNLESPSARITHKHHARLWQSVTKFLRNLFWRDLCSPDEVTSRIVACSVAASTPLPPREPSRFSGDEPADSGAEDGIEVTPVVFDDVFGEREATTDEIKTAEFTDQSELAKRIRAAESLMQDNSAPPPPSTWDEEAAP